MKWGKSNERERPTPSSAKTRKAYVPFSSTIKPTQDSHHGFDRLSSVAMTTQTVTKTGKSWNSPWLEPISPSGAKGSFAHQALNYRWHNWKLKNNKVIKKTWATKLTIKISETSGWSKFEAAPNVLKRKFSDLWSEKRIGRASNTFFAGVRARAMMAAPARLKWFLRF